MASSAQQQGSSTRQQKSLPPWAQVVVPTALAIIAMMVASFSGVLGWGVEVSEELATLQTQVSSLVGVSEEFATLQTQLSSLIGVTEDLASVRTQLLNLVDVPDRLARIEPTIASIADVPVRLARLEVAVQATRDGQQRLSDSFLDLGQQLGTIQSRVTRIETADEARFADADRRFAEIRDTFGEMRGYLEELRKKLFEGRFADWNAQQHPGGEGISIEVLERGPWKPKRRDIDGGQLEFTADGEFIRYTGYEEASPSKLVSGRAQIVNGLLKGNYECRGPDGELHWSGEIELMKDTDYRLIGFLTYPGSATLTMELLLLEPQ